MKKWIGFGVVLALVVSIGVYFFIDYKDEMEIKYSSLEKDYNIVKEKIKEHEIEGSSKSDEIVKLMSLNKGYNDTLEEYQDMILSLEEDNELLKEEVLELSQLIESYKDSVNNFEKLNEYVNIFLDRELEQKRVLLEEYPFKNFNRSEILSLIQECEKLNSGLCTYYGPLSLKSVNEYENIEGLKGYYPLKDYNYEELKAHMKDFYTDDITELLLGRYISFDLSSDSTLKYYDGLVFARDGGMGSPMDEWFMLERSIVELKAYSENSVRYHLYIPIVLVNYEAETPDDFGIKYREEVIDFRYEDGKWKIDTDITWLSFL